MRYFSYISNYYNPKNRLEKAVREYLNTQNRKVIEKNALRFYKSAIQGSIDKLNQEHPRCKPLNPIWDEAYSSKNDSVLRGVSHICNFYLYSSREDDIPNYQEDQTKHLGAKL